jgi:predicted nucleic-acid-binding Zn-ribbon protein
MSEPIQCPKCNQYKFEASFIDNKGSGFAPFILGIIVFCAAIFLPSVIGTVLGYIGLFLFVLGIGTSIYTVFIQKRKDITYKCKNCNYTQKFLK